MTATIRIARIAIDCSDFGPTHLERAHKVAECLEEIARRLRIDCHLLDSTGQTIREDGQKVGTIEYEELMFVERKVIRDAIDA